ncbi:MAG: asparaginase domain-containing protein, partial [Candidatus Thermoplasmatota archaeon]
MVEYPAPVKRLLDAPGAAVGDRVRVTGGGRAYEGVVMPHTEFSGADILVLKLDTGYNVGVPMGPDTTVGLVGKGQPGAVARTLPAPKARRPTAAVLGTGGTIASYVDYRTGAVHPAVTAEELVFSVPELLDVCNVRARVICSVFSENLNATHWQELAAEAAKELNGGAQAVIIP